MEPDPAKRLPRSRLWTILTLVVVVPLLLYALWIGLVITPGQQRARVLEIPFQVVPGDPAPATGRRGDPSEWIVEARITAIPRYILADIGDVRLALRRFPGPVQLVSSPELTAPVRLRARRPAPKMDLPFSGGSGGVTFTSYSVGGITTCELNIVRFTIQSSTLSIQGRRIPIGRGPRIVFLDETGMVREVVEVNPGQKK